MRIDSSSNPVAALKQVLYVEKRLLELSSQTAVGYYASITALGLVAAGFLVAPLFAPVAVPAAAAVAAANAAAWAVGVPVAAAAGGAAALVGVYARPTPNALDRAVDRSLLEAECAELEKGVTELERGSKSSNSRAEFAPPLAEFAKLQVQLKPANETEK